jgi:hypothetical protein
MPPTISPNRVPRQEEPILLPLPDLLKKAARWWLVLCAAAFTAGTARVKILEPRIGELAAHQLGTLFLCAIIAAVAYCVVAKSKLTPADALRLGTIWLLMTLAFEFGFFHYAVRVPWEKLLADYNIAKGRIWPLTLATNLLAPWLIARWRKAGT